MVTRIDHIGIAVRDLGQAARLYEGVLGVRCQHTETVETEQVRVAFFPVGESEIELLEATAAESPIARFIERRGEGLHHLCLEVPDIEAALRQVRAAGVPVLEPAPRDGAHGSRVAFLHPKGANGVLVELVQRGRPAAP